MEKIFSRLPPKKDRDTFRKEKEFLESIRHLLPSEALQAIAERKFRKPIVIFDRWAMRPFWRDGRKAPPLPLEKNKR